MTVSSFTMELCDAAVPPRLGVPPTRRRQRHDVEYLETVWSEEALAQLVELLATEGAEALHRLPRERLLDAWSDAIAELADAASPLRRELDPPLAAACGLSPPGLAAALATVLEGAADEPARRLARAAPALTRPRTPVLVVLAGNLPALAVQPLLPALLQGRPTILKSPSREPFFTPALVTALARREPALGRAVAALTWRGGDLEPEAPLLAGCSKVLVYGEDRTLELLRDRAPGEVVGFGSKASLALVGADADLDEAARGLARDIGLFDQRGCLSVQAIYTAGPPQQLADALARELIALEERWPTGEVPPQTAGAVQQLRGEADLLGLYRPPLTVRQGTVVVDPKPLFRPGPGLRCVRIHPLAQLDEADSWLRPWQGRLQGIAWSGPSARAAARTLRHLGVSRTALAGELQRADVTWDNGGLAPLEALG